MLIKGRRALVVGLGISGIAAARLLVREGAAVSATDLRPAERLGPELNDLEKIGVKMTLGRHPDEVFEAAGMIVLSPGVSLDLPPLAAAANRGAEIIGEMGLAALLMDKPLVAVSGTNGKSTTTALVAHLLEAAGKAVFLGGNIGRPLSEYLLDRPRADLAVVEVSSFQLETMSFFKPSVAVMTNLSPDHLDRHRTFDAYARAKARLWADLDAGDALVVNGEDEALLSLVRDCRARHYVFGLAQSTAPGSYLAARTRASLLDTDGRTAEVDISGWKLTGRINLENLLAALAAAWLAGADPEAMSASLAGFKALPHRLEWVGRVEGVDYYDDSKATNVVSAAKAVAGFDRPVILIAGGLDKGAGYRELAEAAKGRVKAAVLIGQAAGLIAAELNGVCPVHQAGGLAAAVSRSRELAEPGDAVVLSPACASYDQFDNYGHRGRVFAQLVREM